jgi:hypothetical protein
MPNSKNNRKRGQRALGTGQPSGADRSTHLAARGMSQAKPSKNRISIDEYGEAYDALNVEGDRGAAVMGAALVEDGLAQALKAFIVNGDVEAQVFDDPGSPFGTFRNKTLSAYALGLIDKQMANDIKLIREIRNEFSHSLTVISFVTHTMSSRCRKLTHHCNDPSLYAPWDNDSIRYVYVKACKSVLMSILARTREIWINRGGAES